MLHVSHGGSGARPDHDGPSSLDLGFEPAVRHRWRSGPRSSTTIVLDVHGPAGAPEPWALDEAGRVATVTGHVRHRGRSWSAPGAWPRELAALGTRPDRSTLHEDLRGTFAALCLDADGDGWVTTDPVAFRWLYVAERPGELVIGSRAALVARTLTTLDGRPPARDERAVAWLPATAQHLGRCSGHTGIRVVEPGAILRLRNGRPSWDTAPGPIATAPAATGTTSPAEVANAAAALVDEVAESLHAALSLPIEERAIELTGGKDSRLVLAVAVHAGIHHEFEYETIGPPTLPDVQVATSLAVRLGLRHRTRFLGMKPTMPYLQMVPTFVERAGGLVNGWDAITGADDPEVRIGGIFGEAIRSSFKVPDPSRPDGGLHRIYGRGRFDRLGLLRPEVATSLLDELNEQLRTRPRPDADPYLRLHDSYLAGRLASARFGPQEELLGESVRFMPLYSLAALRIGLQLSGPAREDELIFAEVMRSASDLLVRHPFAATSDWRPGAVAYLSERPPGPPAPEVVAPAPATPPSTPAPAPGDVEDPAVPERSTPNHPRTGAGTKAPSLMQLVATEGRAERLALLDHAFERAGPGFESIVDPGAARDAASLWDELKAPDRRQLFGAATAALWLSGPPAPVDP